MPNHRTAEPSPSNKVHGDMTRRSTEKLESLASGKDEQAGQARKELKRRKKKGSSLAEKSWTKLNERYGTIYRIPLDPRVRECSFMIKANPDVQHPRGYFYVGFTNHELQHRLEQHRGLITGTDGLPKGSRKIKEYIEASAMIEPVKEKVPTSQYPVLEAVEAERLRLEGYWVYQA